MTVNTLREHWRNNGITRDSSADEIERVAADWFQQRYPWMAAADISKKARAVAQIEHAAWGHK